MSDVEFYGDWIFYGGILAAIGVMLSIYIYGKKNGVESLNWKVNSVIIAIFAFPALILPVLLSPVFPLYKKIAITLGAIFFMALRYFATTKAQESMWELRKMANEANKQREQSKDQGDWLKEAKGPNKMKKENKDKDQQKDNWF